MRKETVTTVRICFPTSSKVRQNLVKFWMKFVTGWRHQPQQGLLSVRIGLAKFGKVCPWMERVRSSFTCYTTACGDMMGVLGSKV